MPKLVKWIFSVLVIVSVIVLAYWAYMINFAIKVNYIQIGMENKFNHVPPKVPQLTGNLKVLVFNKTNSYRHYDAIDAASEMFDKLAKKNGWDIYQTNNGAIHNTQDLNQFDVIVWQNVSGDVLTETQRAALKNWVEEGGTWLGLHGSGGDKEYAWDWYAQELLGAQFIGHNKNPQFVVGGIVKEQPHPATDGLENVWSREEEFYSFKQSIRGKADILLSLDENTVKGKMDYPMGKDHPLAWAKSVGQGKAIYSALGHKPDYYKEPMFMRFMEQSVQWLANQNQRQSR